MSRPRFDAMARSGEVVNICVGDKLLPPISNFFAVSVSIRRCLLSSGVGESGCDVLKFLRRLLELVTGERLSFTAPRGLFNGGISVE